MGAVNIRAIGLHWISKTPDDPADLCAHGAVELRVKGELLVKPDQGTWTLSAAALYLLRTLTQNHTKNSRVAKHLFPHCGNMMIDEKGEDDVVILGCDSGVNFDVVHDGNDVVLTVPDGLQYRFPATDWIQAVCDFSDTVKAFYDAASPKQPHDETDRAGFRKFLAEWSRRRSLAET